MKIYFLSFLFTFIISLSLYSSDFDEMSDEDFNKGYEYWSAEDYENAHKYFSKCAIKNNKYCIYNLAYLYKDGLGVNTDLNKAFELMNVAADLGYAGAQAVIGEWYFTGLGDKEINYEKSLIYLFSAAQQGAPDAIFRLGNFHEFGLAGIEANCKTAARLYQISAENGWMDGVYNLAVMAASGSCMEAVPQNYFNAFIAMKTLGACGDEEAAEHADSIYSLLSKNNKKQIENIDFQCTYSFGLEWLEFKSE